MLQAVGPSTLNRSEQFAFWINLYNAETVRTVLSGYPVRSMLLVRPGLFSIGPWRRKTLCVDGVRLSLDDIENRILRPGFADPRVHYALNCASTGCPSLRATAWRALNLDEELDEAARATINHSRAVRTKNGRLVLSRIFKWYRKDFGKTDEAVLAHIAGYANPPLAAALRDGRKIGGYAYDWSLNSRRRVDGAGDVGTGASGSRDHRREPASNPVRQRHEGEHDQQQNGDDSPRHDHSSFRARRQGRGA